MMLESCRGLMEQPRANLVTRSLRQRVGPSTPRLLARGRTQAVRSSQPASRSPFVCSSPPGAARVWIPNTMLRSWRTHAVLVLRPLYSLAPIRVSSWLAAATEVCFCPRPRRFSGRTPCAVTCMPYAARVYRTVGTGCPTDASAGASACRTTHTAVITHLRPAHNRARPTMVNQVLEGRNISQTHSWRRAVAGSQHRCPTRPEPDAGYGSEGPGGGGGSGSTTKPEMGTPQWQGRTRTVR